MLNLCLAFNLFAVLYVLLLPFVVVIFMYKVPATFHIQIWYAFIISETLGVVILITMWLHIKSFAVF